MLRTFISDRAEIACKRLEDDKDYLKICEWQKGMEAMVDELPHHLKKDKRITIRRYYEDETEKYCMEGHKIYIQGLQDSVKFLSLLSVFSAKEWTYITVFDVFNLDMRYDIKYWKRALSYLFAGYSYRKRWYD